MTTKVSLGVVAANAVDTAQIASAAVETASIAGNAVVSSKIAANQITTDKIAANAITLAKITSGTLTADSLADNSITAAKIAQNSVGISELNVSDGTNGQYLQTNGSGTLSFSTVSGYTDSDVETYLNTSEIYTDPTNNYLGVGAGASTPSYVFHVQKSVASGTLAKLQNNSNTASDVLLLNTAGTGSGTNILDVQASGSSKFLVRGDGNVGIGTTSPDTALEISIGSTADGLLLSSTNVDTSGRLFLQNATAGEGYAILQENGHLDFRSAATAGTTSGTQRVRINSTGNVGIGTTTLSPISGSVRSLSLGGTSTTVSGGVVYQVNGTVKGYHYIDNDFLVHQTISGVGQRFWGGASEAMRIDSSGRVGIGTITSQAELHVVDSLTGNNSNITTSSPTIGLFERNGDAEITILGNAANHTSINFSDDTHSAGEIRYVHGTGTDEMRFYTASTQRAVIDSSGNVGISTTAPHGKLHIAETASGAAGVDFPITLSSDRYQADYALGIAFRPENQATGYKVKTAILASGGGYGYNQADLHFCLNSNNSTSVEVSLSDAVMTLKKSGNVGIGEASPDTVLHVTGNQASSGTHLDDFATLLVEDDEGRIQIMADNSGNDGAVLGLSTGAHNWGVKATGPLQNNRFSIGYYNSSAAGNNFTWNAGVEALQILTTGEVGIGGTPTTSSAMYLHAGGRDYVTYGESTDAKCMMSVRDNSSTVNVEYGAWGNSHVFSKDGSSQVRIDSSGKVGIGKDSPLHLLHVASTGPASIMIEADTDNATESDNATLYFSQDGSLVTSQIGTNSDNNFEIQHNFSTGSIVFHTNGANERMQIKGNDGTVMINRTSSFGAANSACMIVTGSGKSSCAFWTAPNTGGYDIHTFFNGGLGVIGIIEQNSSLNGVSYNTSSDYRLKENINYDWDATSILKQLRPAEYNFISDPNDTYQQGFVAHELQEHLPFAVSGIKDAMTPATLYEETDQEVIDGEAQVGDIKEEEKIKPQQVDYSKIVTLLVKTVQELEARITELEG